MKGEMAKIGPLAQPGGDSSNWLTGREGMKRIQGSYVVSRTGCLYSTSAEHHAHHVSTWAYPSQLAQGPSR